MDEGETKVVLERFLNFHGSEMLKWGAPPANSVADFAGSSLTSLIP